MIKDLTKIHKSDAKKIFSKIENLEKFLQVQNLKKLKILNHPIDLKWITIRIFFDIED